MESRLPVPRHLRSPGDDGYRTPTIEDAEQTLEILGATDSLGGARETHTSALEAALQRASSRATDNTVKNGYSKEKSHCAQNVGANFHRTLTESSASTLSWKKRIRHVTWAYFTLTMATGGLANVLYEGA